MYKIDDFGIQPIAGGTPLVLFNEMTRQDVDLPTMLVQPGQPGNQGLAEGSNSHDVVESGRHIEDTELNGAEKRVGADIPPDFLAIIDAAGTNQRLNVGIEIGPRGEGIGQPAAMKTPPHNGAIGLESGEASGPEGGV